MREYTGLPETMPGLESITTNDRNQPLSPLTHNTGNVGDAGHFWNTLWTNRLVCQSIETYNNIVATDNGDAYGLLTMNGDATALDKDGTALPLWGMTASYYRVAGAWVERNAAFSFKQWSYATEIDPYSDTAKDVWFITKNKARSANLDHTFSPSVAARGALGKNGFHWKDLWALNWKYATNIDVQSDTPMYLSFITKNKAGDADIDHIFAPSVDLHGRLGDAITRWLSAHVGTITPGTIDVPTTDVTDCLDEDTMVSNSATALATQQSIKAYVDNLNYRKLVETEDVYWEIQNWLEVPGIVAEELSGSGNIVESAGNKSLRSGTTTASYAAIYAQKIFDNNFHIWGSSYIVLYCEIYVGGSDGVNRRAHIVLGRIADRTTVANIAIHIGFKFDGQTLYGTVGDGGAESTLSLRTNIDFFRLKMKVIFDPSTNDCHFYTKAPGTESVWTDEGTISTNLPSSGIGTENILRASIYTADAVENDLDIYEWRVLVEAS